MSINCSGDNDSAGSIGGWLFLGRENSWWLIVEDFESVHSQRYSELPAASARVHDSPPPTSLAP